MTDTESVPRPHVVGTLSQGPVVLYARGDTPAQGHRRLSALRTYAHTEGLTVLDILGDVCHPDQHMALRPQWARVVEAIEDGTAAGVLCQQEQEIASHPAIQSVLRGWLQQRRAYGLFPGPLPGLADGDER